MQFDGTIAIVGAGAVGGYYGARLAQHDADVHFLLRSDYDAVRSRGWTVHSCHGDFALSPGAMHVYNDARTMPKVDLVVVTLKATENGALESLVAPLLHDDTAILTLQNGLGNEDLLARLFGAERVLGGLAFVCINRGAPGVIHHLDHGLVRLGEFAGRGDSSRARAIVERFAASNINCQVLPDLRLGRWDKLVWNVPFNGLGALLDATTDRLLGSDAGLALVRGLMAEVVAAARADGAMLEDAVIEQKIAATTTMGGYRSSMQVDRQLGRPMEVEAIFGEPLRRARAAGVPTPRLEMLYHALRLLDRHPPTAP